MLAYLRETKNAFASKLGYNRAQTIYDITEGEECSKLDFFKKFQMSEYSDIINIDWLITGRTPMLKEVKDISPSTNLEHRGSPYYNVDFIGGFDLYSTTKTFFQPFT